MSQDLASTEEQDKLKSLSPEVLIREFVRLMCASWVLEGGSAVNPCAKSNRNRAFECENEILCRLNEAVKPRLLFLVINNAGQIEVTENQPDGVTVDIDKSR